MLDTRFRDRRFIVARLRRMFGGIFLLGITGPVMAGTFNVVPPRLELPSSQRSGTVEVISSQDTPMLIRASMRHWTQANGETVYDSVDDLAVVPPVFKLAGKGRQVLRIGFLGRPKLYDTEQAYRLFLAEVPNGVPDAEAASPPKEVRLMIKTKLTLDMPVYIMPHRSVDVLRASMQVGADGVRQVVLDNGGSVHQRLDKVELVGGNSHSTELGANVFILPGATRRLSLGSDATALPPPYRLRFQRDLDPHEIDISAP